MAGLSLGTESFFLQSPPKERRGIEKIKLKWLWLVLRGGALPGFNAGAEFPEEGGEFPGNADFDFVVVELSFSQGAEAMTESGLGFPG